MARKPNKSSPVQRFAELGGVLERLVPHLYAVLEDEGSFLEIRLKLRDDATVLAVVKCSGADGGPLVCFGSGYGVAGALMAVDATIQGGYWKVDKPWPSSGK